MRAEFCAKSKIVSPLLCLLLSVAIVSPNATTNVVTALDMIILDAPSFAFGGETINLSCAFELNNNNNNKLPTTTTTTTSNATSGEKVYSVKWFRDEQEFFRFVASDSPQKQLIATNGISIDTNECTETSVILKNVSSLTSGLFKCEVSLDAPFFTTKFLERQVQVLSIPNQRPTITVEPPIRQTGGAYKLGDKINVTCTSEKSKPSAMLDWIVSNSMNLTELLLSRPTKASNSSSLQQALSLQFFSMLNTQRVFTHPLVANNTPPQTQYIEVQLPSLSSQETSNIVFDDTKSDLNTTNMPKNVKKSLHQLLQSSSSKLSFSVSSSFLQFAQQITTATTPSASAFKSSSKASRINNYQTALRTKSSSQNNNIFVSLSIKCVSRVLHLSMSDEILVRLLVSPSSLSPNNNQTTFSSGQQQRKAINNLDGTNKLQNRFQPRNLFLSKTTTAQFSNTRPKNNANQSNKQWWIVNYYCIMLLLLFI